MTSLFEIFGRGRRITSIVTATMAGVIILAVLVITVLDVARQREIFERQFEEKGLALSRTLNDVLANPLYFRDMQKLRHLSDVAKAQPEIISLTIFAPDGRILIAPGNQKFPSGRVSGEVIGLVNTSTTAIIHFHEAFVEVLTPVVVSGDVIGGIRFLFDNSTLSSQINDTILQHIWQGGLVMLFGIGLSYLFAQSIVRPVRQMVGITDRIAAGDFEFSVEQDRSDEIGQLARALEKMTKRLQETERKRAEEQNAQLRESNELLVDEVAERRRAQQESETISQNLERALDELRQTQEKMVQQERLSAVGQMSSGIAHDINNRLQIILGLSDRLLLEPGYRFGSTDAQSKLKMIRESVQDAADVVGLLRDFYRPKKSSDGLEPLDLSEIVKDAVQLTEPRWKDQAQRLGIHFDVATELQDLPAIEGSPAELREALINLLFNAIDASPTGGTITIRTRIDSDDAVIEVADSGVGMTDEVRRRCMEPFFTTKGARGSGLGLAMIYRTVQRHGGTLEVDSRVGHGTTVRLRFPCSTAAVARTQAGKAVASAGPLDILITDDEPLVRKMIAALLEHDGHRVVTACDGSDGLQKFRDGCFDLVILDRAMPGMNGDELALHIKRLAPTVPVIMLTGFGSLMNAANEMPDSVDLTLGKPVRHADLSNAVAAVIRAGAGDSSDQDPRASADPR